MKPHYRHLVICLGAIALISVATSVWAESGRAVSQDLLQRVYEEVKTPYKYGIVLRPGEDELLDCPNVFRCGDKWYMVYVSNKNKIGYETLLAESDDLLQWKQLGTVLPLRRSGQGDSPLFANGAGEQGGDDSPNKGIVPDRRLGTVPAWDQWQANGSIALVDPMWGGSCELQKFDGKYWMSYFGGAKQGYETDPLSIGIAWTTTPDKPVAWTRSENNPVLTPGDADARPFERKTLYKSQVLWDKARTLGHPFVMYYNGKEGGSGWTERIGIATSDDMVNWKRYGDGPVIDNSRGISGDPQIVKMSGEAFGGDLWVMFYFGAFWKPRAFDTFACSPDLVHWTKWTGPHLIEPSEPWDKTFAHKPWVLKHDGVVYHFYCAVGDQGRAIALATSKDLRSSTE
jgi:predicted GH43/DUF377 family glycosyl hydrolase